MQIKVNFVATAVILELASCSPAQADILKLALRSEALIRNFPPQVRDAVSAGTNELRLALATWRTDLAELVHTLGENSFFAPASPLELLVDDVPYGDVTSIPKQLTLSVSLGKLTFPDGIVLAADPAVGPEPEHFVRFQVVEGEYNAVVTLEDTEEQGGFEVQSLDIRSVERDGKLTWHPTCSGVKMDGGHGGFFAPDAIKQVDGRIDFVERCFHVTRDKSWHWQNEALIPAGLVGADVGVCAFHEEREAYVPVLASVAMDGTGRLNALRLDFANRR